MSTYFILGTHGLQTNETFPLCFNTFLSTRSWQETGIDCNWLEETGIGNGKLVGITGRTPPAGSESSTTEGHSWVRKCKRETYTAFTNKQRVAIGKNAAENGTLLSWKKSYLILKVGLGKVQFNSKECYYEELNKQKMGR